MRRRQRGRSRGSKVSFERVVATADQRKGDAVVSPRERRAGGFGGARRRRFEEETHDARAQKAIAHAAARRRGSTMTLVSFITRPEHKPSWRRHPLRLGDPLPHAGAVTRHPRHARRAM